MWLVKERRQLKKQWRKAAEEEKKGINILQAKVKDQLSTLRTEERKRLQKKRVRPDLTFSKTL